MVANLGLPDLLSLSRIPLAIFFVGTYASSELISYSIGIFLVAMAAFTDFLDGKIARATAKSSFQGYLLDGLGDKIFHTAIIIVFVREGYSHSILGLLLIGREIALYAFRVLDENCQQSIGKFRTISLIQVSFLRMYFVLFFIQDGLKLAGFEFYIPILLSQMPGWIAAIVGLYGIRQLFIEVVVRSNS